MLKGKTKIRIDYSLCGESGQVDPRGCGLCLRACAPAVFLLHETPGAVEENPCDPQKWRITALWTSLCTRCNRCVDVCPRGAITVDW